jgi:adenylate cyclase
MPAEAAIPGLSGEQRKLAAVMFTDMVGFTALTQSDEAQSMAVLERHNRVLRPIFPKFHGREVKTIGDSFLVEFDSALDATNCAVEIQRLLHEYNISSRDEWKVTLRIGIHLGDVVHSGGDIFGDAVNIASRLQPLAEPEGVCISEQVYDQVRNKIPQALVKLEPHDLKGVKFTVDAYKVTMPWEHVITSSSVESDKMRIAVLPFTNLSSNPEEGYFADGMTEELITSLSGVRQLTVIARTSVMGYKGTTKKVKEIGKELEAGSILEGSVRKAGNKVRITAQLIDAATEGHLWAQNYDRELEDVFGIQSEIAEKVAGELKVRLVEDERRVIEKKATESTEAYTYYLRGRELIRELTEPSLRQALGVFEKAISLDQSFAKAHVGIAESYMELVNGGYEPYEQVMPKAELLVKKALQLDPDLAEAHAILASVDYQEDDVQGAEAECNRALELNPSLPDPYFILSNIAFLKQNRDEGLRNAEACYRLDPGRPRYVERMGRYYYFMGREDEALRHWEKTAQLAPAGTYRNLTEYYLSKGDIEKAKEFYSKAERLEPTNRWVTWMKGFIAAKVGDREGALAVIKDIEGPKWVGSTNLNDIAYVHYALDDLDSYFVYVHRALDQHSFQPWMVMYSPLLAKGRDDARYQGVLEEVKKMVRG